MSKIVKDLAKLEEQERRLQIERALTFQKALESRDTETILKAQSYYQNFMTRQQPAKVGTNEMKAMIIDPFESTVSNGYFAKNSLVGYDGLRAMSNAPIPRAAILTRKNQIAEFCKRQDSRYDKGYRILPVGIKDLQDLSDQDKKVEDKVSEFIDNCGLKDKDAWDWKYDTNFESFIRKVIDDSLTFDQLNAEIIPQRNFQPYAFIATDASTMRIADSFDDRMADKFPKVRNCYPSYLQLYMNQPIAEFYPWEMMWGIRNPTTNVRKYGYGTSELEYMIQIITSMLNGDAYNANFFKRGAAPGGMLMIKKSQGINKDRIAEFRREFDAMLSGVQNSHKVPILDAESFEWIDMRKNNKDMEFSLFQEYLIKLVCALYTISPEEIGFPLQGSKGSGLGSKEGGQQEKDYSLNKGLKPLLTFVQNLINKYIVGPLTNYLYKFQFVGIEIESVKDEQDRVIKAVSSYMTVDEGRALMGLKPLPKGQGKIILNPIFSSMQMNGQQQQFDQQNKLEEEDNNNRINKNPFLDEEESKKSPFMKAFNDLIEEKLVA